MTPTLDIANADHRTRDLALRIGLEYGLVLLTAAIYLFFALYPKTSESFASIGNFRAILANQSVQLLQALAFTVPLIANELELSLGGVYALTGMLFAGLMSNEDLIIGGTSWHPLLAASAALMLGALYGLLNGTLVTRLRIDSLICTLGTGIVAGGLVLFYSDGTSISGGLPRSLLRFGTGTTIGLPHVALVAALIATAVWFVLERTVFGRQLAAIGSNRRAAELVGVPVARVILWGFVAAGLLAGAAGLLQVSRQGSGVPTSGIDQIIAAFAATYLGANVIKPGRFNVLGTVIGLLFVAGLVTGLSLLGVDSWVKPVVYGGSLVVAMAASAALRARLR